MLESWNGGDTSVTRRAQLGSFCAFRPPGHRRTGQIGFVSHNRRLPGTPSPRYPILPKFGFVLHISLQPIGFVCTAGLASPGGRPQAFVNPQSPIEELGLFVQRAWLAEIGFVLHVLHSRVPTCHPQISQLA